MADIEPVLVRHIAAELNERGIDPRLALDGSGLFMDHLARPNLRLSYMQTSHVIRRALRLSGEPHLGLRLGAQVNLVTWNAAYLGLLASANSHEMLRFAAQYLPSAAGLLRLRYEDSPGGPRIVAQSRFDEPVVQDFLIEKAFSSLVRTCKNVLGDHYVPTSVEFAMVAPRDHSVHAQSLGCRVHFARPSNAIHFPARVVSIPTADAAVVKQVRAALDANSDASQRQHELEVSIVNALQNRFDDPPSLAEIASGMHLSERTLRRRLAELDIGYAQLLDRERKHRALTLLRAGLPLFQVATATGFCDVRNLRRAVKRWTGLSPTALKHKESRD